MTKTDNATVYFANERVAFLEKSKKNQARDSAIFEGEIRKLSQLFVTDQIRYAYFTTLCSKSLSLCRDNNINEAERLLTKARYHIEECDLDEQNFLNLWYLPIVAFIQYKKKDYSTAVELTLKTMELDSKFETVNSGIFYHKIQQLQNIARVEAKREVILSANAYNAIYRILILKEIVNYRGVCFNVRTHLDNNDYEILRHLMFVQALEENIFRLDKLENKQLQKDYFLRSFHFFTDEASSVNNLELCYWIKAKKSLLDGDNLSDAYILNYLKELTESSSIIAIKSLIN